MVKDSRFPSRYNTNTPPENCDKFTLKQIAADVHYLRQHGVVWQDVLERVAAAERDRRRDLQNEAIGHEVYVDWLADDVAKLTGVSRGACQRAAREAFMATRVETVAATLRAIVEEEHERRNGRKAGAA